MAYFEAALLTNLTKKAKVINQIPFRMEKNPLPPTETGLQSPSPDLAQIQSIQDALDRLARSLTTLSNGIRSFSQLEPSEASNGFNLARRELEKFRHAVVTTRSKLSKLLQIIGQDPSTEDLSAITFAKNRNPNSPLWVASRLISGIAGCKNSIKTLLKQDEHLLKKEISESGFGQKYFSRLSNLSTLLEDMEFGTPEEAKKAVRNLQEKTVTLSNHFSGPKTKNRIDIPITSERAHHLMARFDCEEFVFHNELRHKIAKKILEQSVNNGEGLSLEGLRDCFDGLSNLQLKKELEALRQEIKHFDLILTGSFEPRGRPLITLKIQHPKSSSAPSTK